MKLIETIEQAEEFVLQLKRAENWVSNEELLALLNSCLKLIKTNKREDLLDHIYIHLSLYYIDIGDYNQAWEYAEAGKKYAKLYHHTEKLINILSIQYKIQNEIGSLEKAQEIINEQIDNAYQINDAELIASAYMNQAFLCHKQRLKMEAIEAIELSVKYIIKSKKDFYIASFSIGFSGILIDFNELTKAEKYLKLGFKIAQEKQLLSPLALAYSNFGLLYAQKKEEKKSINALKKCIQIYRQLNNNSNVTKAQIMLANTYIQFNRLAEAEVLLKESEANSVKENIRYNLIGIYGSLSTLLEKQHQYKEALEYHKKLIATKEDYLSRETEKRIQNLEVNKRIEILKLEKATAEKMANVKHDFLANMSHEIRTPINSILGICYLLEQQSLNEVQTNYVHRLQRSGENLLGIINDVLDISKVESGKMELTAIEFSLSELLKDIFNALEPKAIEKHLQFNIVEKFDKGLLLLGDKIRTYQFLLNFAANAIKFTNVGGVKITVSTKQERKEEIFIIFQIQDSGIGIAKNKISTVFERFEQADVSIKSKFGGTGLGLSISKKIIELMRGTIAVKSKVNKGTTFTLTIPYKIASATNELHADATAIDTAALNDKIILIADDNEENRLIAKEILLGYNSTIKIMEAGDGLEVIHLLFKKIPDIIFMDLDMPNLNGIETTQQIRRNKKYDKIKIIGNTASLSTLSNEEIEALGFDAFILKPYQPDALIRLFIA
ncbi:MAG: ATP-binding protein [Chitinophagales bacterium]